MPVGYSRDEGTRVHPLGEWPRRRRSRRGALPARLLADLAAVHPASNAGHPTVPFQICDLVQIRSGENGTQVRLQMAVDD